MNIPLESDRQIFEYHPRIGLRYIPGIKARIPHESGGYLVRTNQAGFRCDRELDSPRAQGKRRALLFGDSFTAGNGVSNGRRFGDHLESLVPDLEVFNFGLPGTGTDQQYLAFDEIGRTVDYDLLIIAVQVDNIRRNAARYKQFLNERGLPGVFAKPYFEIHDGQLVLAGVPVRRDEVPEEELPPAQRTLIDRGGRFQALRNAANAMGIKDLVQRLTHYQPLPEYDDPSNPAWVLTRMIIEHWIRGAGKPALVIPVPLYMYVEETSDPSGYQARFRELAESTGCVVHDPLPDLLAYPASERRTFRPPVDFHPSPAGHQALGRSLAPVVERLLRAA